MLCKACNFENSPNNLICENCHEKLYRAKLRVIFDSGLDKSLHLFPRSYKIGRAADNDIVIDDPSVSRYHAEINYESGDYVFKDTGSKNGCTINQHLVTQKKLETLDCIQLGNIIIHFYDENENALLPRAGFRTEEIVQQEFFKYIETKRTNIQTDEILQTMLNLAISLLHAEQGVILLKNASNELQFKIAKNYEGESISKETVTIDWSLVDDCLQTQELKMASEDLPSSGPYKNEVNFVTSRKIAIPILSSNSDNFLNEQSHDNNVLGIFYFTGCPSLSKKKRELLSTLIQHAAIAVENKLLYNEAVEKRKLEDELSVARNIQQRLLPSTAPHIPNFEIASFMQPCKMVSGDYFDFIPISSGVLGIAIGDICGKGVPAALLTATVHSAIRTQLEYTSSPKEIIRSINRLMIKSTNESIFVTLFFGVLNIESGQFKYVNAGHPPPIIISNDKKRIRELRSTTTALGILEDELLNERRINIKPGDTLLLYTDGILESRNMALKMYGRRRLLQFIRSHFFDENRKSFTPEAFIKSINDDLIAFTNKAKFQDDITLLVVARNFD